MTIYLITGASRGLGRALTEAFIAKPGNVVIAAVRDPSQDTSQALCKLPSGEGSEMILVKIDSTSDTDAANAAKVLVTKHNIQRIDVVVANAGFGETWGDLSEVKPEEVRDLVDINALGPLRLLQAFRALLEKANNPRFVLMGTPIASISAMEKSPFPMFAYGASKVAAHYMTRKLHCESPEITAFVIDPGFMQTDMGNRGARHFGYEQAFVPVDVACSFAVDKIETATKEETSGKFLTNDKEHPYIEW